MWDFTIALAIGLVIGFILGYGVRAIVSYRRHRRARRRSHLFRETRFIGRRVLLARNDRGACLHLLCSSSSLSSSPPAEKATTSKDQAGQTGTGDGGGDCQEYPPRCGHDLSSEQKSYFDC